MRTHPSLSRAVSLSALGLLFVPHVFAGPLNPPAGAIGSSGKTLTEVEPRIAINATNTPSDGSSVYRITQPGSYYLTGDITVAASSNRGGIRVDADNVTIDLNGFAVVGAPGNSNGIVGSARTGITVRNGMVRNWPSNGLNLGGGATVRDVQVLNCGATPNAPFVVAGIIVGTGSRVEGCSATGCRVGIYAAENVLLLRCTAAGSTEYGMQGDSGCSLRDCTVTGSGFTGFQFQNATTMVGCLAKNNSGGIQLGNGANLTGCTSMENAFGIDAGAAAVIKDCTVSTITSTGISAGGSVVIKDCTVSDTGMNGIQIENAGTVSGCSVRACQNGISAGDGTLISNNTVQDMTANGVVVSAGCTVLSNTIRNYGITEGNGGSGILATGIGNRIEANNCITGQYGLRVTAGFNIILRNTSGGNSTANWSVAAGNLCLVVNSTLGGAINGNSGGAAPGSTDPSANFTY